MCSGAHGDQRRTSDSLELELEAFEMYLTWMLETELGVIVLVVLSQLSSPSMCSPLLFCFIHQVLGLVFLLSILCCWSLKYENPTGLSGMGCSPLRETLVVVCAVVAGLFILFYLFN